MGTKAGEQALAFAATRGAMRKVGGKLGSTRAARTRVNVGDLDRTLIVVESRELLDGQKRGIAAALIKAKAKLTTLERRCAHGRITRTRLEEQAKKALAHEHLSTFVVTTIGGTESAPTFEWRVDARLRRNLERTRLGKRVLCTDRHAWSTERIITSFRGQWRVEEVFRRAKKGGVVAWGPSHQWADASLRLHTFATVLGLMLVSLAKIALRTRKSARAMMAELAAIEATMVRTSGGMGRRPTHLIPPRLSAEQCAAVQVFELGRWLPQLLSTRPPRRGSPRKRAAA
jgi:transposase